MQGKSDKLVLEPLNFADDHVRHCYGRKGAIFENWPDTLFVNLQYGGRAWSPFFIDYKSYKMKHAHTSINIVITKQRLGHPAVCVNKVMQKSCLPLVYFLIYSMSFRCCCFCFLIQDWLKK